MTERRIARVIVVDDQAVVREGIVMLLGLLPGIEVVGSAGDGEEAVALVAELAPDVVLMDLRMPRCDGVEATRRIRSRASRHPGRGAHDLCRRRLAVPRAAGGSARLSHQGRRRRRDRAGHRRTSWPGEAGLSPVVQRRLLEQVTSAPEPEPRRRRLPDGLTAREGEVLALIAEGLTTRRSPRRLHISTATVKTHINNLFAKTGLHDRAQAVRYAYRRGSRAATWGDAVT